MTTKIIISSVLFALVFVTGIWMSKLGKPYQQVLFTFHKLITLAAIILTAMAIVAFNKQSGLSIFQIVIIITSSVLLLGAMATGGVLSAKAELIKWVQILHKILPVLSAITLIVLFVSLIKSS